MRRKKIEEYRESQVTTINIFDFTFYLLYFARKHSLKKVVYTVAFYLQFFYVAGYLKSSNGFALVLRPQDFRPEIHINRLGITTWIFKAMGYLILMSEKYLLESILEKVCGKKIFFPTP